MILSFILVYGLISGQITVEQIEQYKQELSIFAESFNTDGPGAIGDNLEKGTHTCSLVFIKVCVRENDCKLNNTLKKKKYKKCKLIVMPKEPSQNSGRSQCNLRMRTC